MKNTGLKEYLLALILIWFIIYAALISKQLDDIHNTMQERTRMDSIYIDHIGNCSMIRKDQLEIDSDGYVISTYHKDFLK